MIRSGWPLSMIVCSSAVKPQPHITTTMMSSSASLLACIAPGRSDRGRILTTLVEIAARISPPPPAPTCGRPRSKPARRRQGGSLAQAGSRSVCDGVVNDRFAVEPKAERNHRLADVIGRPSSSVAPAKAQPRQSALTTMRSTRYPPSDALYRRAYLRTFQPVRLGRWMTRFLPAGFPVAPRAGGGCSALAPPTGSALLP
jgi:hypothetical protein